MAGVEQQDDGRDEFVFAEVGRLAFGEAGDEIVARPAAALGGERSHIGGEIARRLRRGSPPRRAVGFRRYIATMRCDQSSSRALSSAGAPISAAMTPTAIGVA